MLPTIALVCLLLVPSPAALPAGTRAPAPPDDEREWKRALRDPWPDARERAVRKLAALGTDAAWGHVVAALEDRSGRVADAAQVALGGLGEPRALARLFGREGIASRKDVVRLRAAEVFGRVAGPVSGEQLARALDPRDAEVARALLWSVERLAARDALAGRRDPLVRAVEGCLGRQRPPRLRAAALVTLARLAPERAAAPAERAAADRSPALRCAALEVSRGAELARALAADPDPGVRRAALDRLARDATRPAVERIVERLEVEPRERLVRLAVAHLQRASGLRHRRDPRPWRAWLAGLPSGWRAGPPAEHKSEERTTRAAGDGLPVHSDRTAYLIDFSGSLWNERTGGKTRKERLDEVLHTTLERLPEGSRFNLVPYTGRPYPWRDELSAVTSRERRAARDFFDDLSITGPGDAYAAIARALEDPEVDTVCLLTDGAPTGGVRWDMSLMVELLLQDTRHRPVTFDVVLIDCPKGLARHWRRLAETTGGTCVALDL